MYRSFFIWNISTGLSVFARGEPGLLLSDLRGDVFREQVEPGQVIEEEIGRLAVIEEATRSRQRGRSSEFPVAVKIYLDGFAAWSCPPWS